MLMIGFSQSGDFTKTIDFLGKAKEALSESSLAKYGEMGVKALERATPKRTGKTAASWYYEVEKTSSSVTITWSNSNVHEGVVVAVLLQHGHGTGTGGYVRGVDYINPALKPVFDKIVEDVWKEVER